MFVPSAGLRCLYNVIVMVVIVSTAVSMIMIVIVAVMMVISHVFIMSIQQFIEWVLRFRFWYWHCV